MPACRPEKRRPWPRRGRQSSLVFSDEVRGANSARRRMRGPLPTRTYQTVLPCRVVSRCRCGGRGRGIPAITERSPRVLQAAISGLWTARSGSRCLSARDAHLDLCSARLLGGPDRAGDVGLRDAGGAAGHVSYRNRNLSAAMRWYGVRRSTADFSTEAKGAHAISRFFERSPSPPYSSGSPPSIAAPILGQPIPPVVLQDACNAELMLAADLGGIDK